jgi:bifunctional N-acetylglucosamine-1-phosphate-uridyltransferase/glucosamine-1-phosphate-acetyltransferase GlmU-like protein
MGEMNANEIVAVVLAVSCERSGWGTKRFLVPIAGTSALARVRRTLAEAGVGDVRLVTDGTAEIVSAASWAHVHCADARGGSDATATASGHQPVLIVCGDLPLLSPGTIRSFAKAFADGQASWLAESTGTLALFGSSAAAERALARAVAAFDDPAGPFVGGAWRADDGDDVLRLAVSDAFPVVSAVARGRVLATLAAGGVLIVDMAQTYVDEGAQVGAETVLLPGTHIRGESRIGLACSVGPDSWIESSTVEDGAVVRYSVLEGARVRERSVIGPFAHLRHGSDVGPEARIGNFVEIKASRLGRGVKVGHLSYLGDADVGDKTNVGAGTITCNYDGAAKHRTVIEDGVFVGSNTSLVAPVTIGRGAVIGAGSTITEDVPEGKLAIARARQVVKERKESTSGEDT